VDAPLLPVISGPTAVGKTALSLRVAQELDAEIISADSMAVYRGLETATAKPSPQERSAVPHHLIDVVDVAAAFSVGDFVALANEAISDVAARDRLPLVVGGTRQYVDALTRGFVEAPPSDPELRERLEREAETSGLASLRTRLLTGDAEAAERIHPNDLRRTVRALEVLTLTGKPISAWQAESRNAPPYRRLLFGLTIERQRLYERINVRVDAMMEAGLEGEVRRLLAEGRLGPTAIQGHGYKELVGHVLGDYSLGRAVYLLKRNTRWHARHQLSWLRQQTDTVWVDLDAGEEAALQLIVSAVHAAQR
jgi:tRNA dimethylallyltransferase